MSQKVSVIIPCFNEGLYIEGTLSAFLDQTHPIADFEVVIADGFSTDGTREVISEFAKTHPELRIILVDNLARNIPCGLNAAIKASSGDYIIRMDGHSLPEKSYIQKCVDGLESNKGDNVGGVWKIQAGESGWMPMSIAAAAAHPLGVGDALYRYTQSAGEVDTVPFGAFKRNLFEKIGMFNESLLTNEDYEFNTRIRKSGGKIWLDPEIKSTYFSRSTLSALAKQYFRYGFWKVKMLKQHKNSIRFRQAIPPLFVFGIILLFISGFWIEISWYCLAIILLVYFLTLLTVALIYGIKQKHPLLIIGMPLAMMTMHFFWGSGFLWSLIKQNSGKLG